MALDINDSRPRECLYPDVHPDFFGKVAEERESGCSRYVSIWIFWHLEDGCVWFLEIDSGPARR
jgi:hypothetical protein